MSVDDWARREAEKRYPMGHLNAGETGSVGNRAYIHEGAVWMAGHALSALLSDEAAEALLDAQQLHTRSPHTGTCVCDPVLRYPFTNDGALAHEKHAALRALQAAIDAVTKGGPQ